MNTIYVYNGNSSSGKTVSVYGNYPLNDYTSLQNKNTSCNNNGIYCNKICYEITFPKWKMLYWKFMTIMVTSPLKHALQSSIW